VLTQDEIGELVDQIANESSKLHDPTEQWAYFGVDYEVIDRLMHGIDAAIDGIDNKMAYCCQIGILIGRKQNADSSQ
jgi:hypothetical protein